MKTVRCQFVGGPADGAVRQMPESEAISTIEVATGSDVASVVRYTKHLAMIPHGDEAEIWVYCPADMTLAEANKLLRDRFPPRRGR